MESIDPLQLMCYLVEHRHCFNGNRATSHTFTLFRLVRQMEIARARQAPQARPVVWQRDVWRLQIVC